MAVFKLTSQIVNAETKVYMAWNGEEAISYDDVRNFIESIPEDDSEIDMRINCAGGDVINGWAMYDALRQSGKNISALIEGECSSMATCVLLAAPKENRRAYKHAHICIHNPESCGIDADYPSRLTADALDALSTKLKSQSERLRDEQKRILDLYVERTGSNADELQALMNEDIYINTDRAKELGFISEVLSPNTALKNKNRNSNIMAKNNVQVEENWLKRLLAKAGFKTISEAKFNDIKVTAADGSEIDVEREEGDVQVGDMATPDGTFVLEDGTTIVVADGVIASIEKPSATSAIKDPSTGAELTPEEAQQLIVDLQAKVAELEEKVAEQGNEATDLKAQVDEKDAVIAQKDMEIEAAKPSAEQNEILAIVAKNGGKAWLDAVHRIQSNGAPKTVQNNAPDSPTKIGASFLANKKKPFRFRTSE